MRPMQAIKRWTMDSCAALALEVFKRLVDRSEALIRRKALHGDREFFENHSFPWVAAAEVEYPAIREELVRILSRIDELPSFQDLSPAQQVLTQDDGWKTFFFYLYGKKFDRNLETCPRTSRLLSTIPGMKTAFFSVLRPGKHLPEHRGPYAGVLRYHLGLKIPTEVDKCWIRVGNTRRSWEEGKSLVFDDTFPHEAMNGTNEVRVVLFVDFKRPLPWFADKVNTLMLQLMTWTPFIQDGVINEKLWEDTFHRPPNQLSNV